MDETGISNVHKPANIVATKGARAVGKITSGVKGKTVTVICATNAVGTYIPVKIIRVELALKLKKLINCIEVFFETC